MKNFLIVSIVFLSATALRAQTILFQENFTTGIPATWAIVNNDGLTPHNSVSNFNNAWIAYQVAPDTCAASTSYYSPAGQAADYLITPKINLTIFSKLVWSARSVDASYPETYLVLISSTDSLITSFTDTLFVVDQELYYWQTRSVQLDLEGYTNQDVYIAFKNITNDGFVLLIDEVKVLGSDFASLESTELADVTVCPNPTTDFVTVSNFKIGDTATLYSLDGQKISTSTSNLIDLSNLTNGTYLIAITNALGTTHTKIVKH